VQKIGAFGLEHCFLARPLSCRKEIRRIEKIRIGLINARGNFLNWTYDACGQPNRGNALRSIELFAGAGGLAIGVGRAGFAHRCVIEWNQDSCDTLRRNASTGHGHGSSWDVWQGDVRDYDFRAHADDIEFISGGPPCQPFSLGGKHRGQADNRNMFPEAVRAVREIRPKAFIFENVKGLLRKGFANYYSYIIQQLRRPEVVCLGDEDWTDHLSRLERLSTSGRQRGLKYNVVYRVLNAADYGVPQHRWRVFIVGVRSDLGIEFSFPEATHEEDSLLHDQWVSAEYWERHCIAKKDRPPMPDYVGRKISSLNALWEVPRLRPWRTVRDAISDLPRLSAGQSSSKIANHFFNPGARSYAGHNGSAHDQPSKALKAGDHGVPGGENTLRLPDGSVRYFSVRECARLQTFPDEWVFSGSWTESMRQLGNAVPVLLAETVARELRKTLVKSETVVERLEAAARAFPRPQGKRISNSPGISGNAP
jgi:DNA (cytosine-5)-methyltransferase 1